MIRIFTLCICFIISFSTLTMSQSNNFDPSGGAGGTLGTSDSSFQSGSSNLDSSGGAGSGFVNSGNDVSYTEGYSCYWMENYTGNSTWVLAPASMFPPGSGIERCKALDSCNGGDGLSGGGCYKWALSPTSQRVSWDIMDRRSSSRSLSADEEQRLSPVLQQYNSDKQALELQFYNSILRVLDDPDLSQAYLNQNK